MPGRAGRCGAGGGVAGAGLSACFILPAMGLLKDANFEGLEAAPGRAACSSTARLGDSGWVQFLADHLGGGGVAGLGGAGLPLAGPRRPRSPLRRAAMVLLSARCALMTVVTLPLWMLLPQLRSIEFPWRATGLLTLPLAAMAALALAGGARKTRPAVLALGLGCAALPPLFVWVMIAYGNPDWPRFMPAGQRLERAMNSPRGISPEHLPVWAVTGRLAHTWDGTETEPGPDAWPRPPLPAGTRRIAGGFLVPEASAPLLLPQFWFPPGQATDGKGAPVAVRPGPGGFLEVAVDRPVRDLRVGGRG